MEDDQTSLRSTDAKQWERPWSTAEIRENSTNWTLAGDTGLLHFLQEYAHNLLSRTHETEKLVNELVYKNKAISAKVNNVINDFQMLSNEQFIENRVYDEDIEDTKISENVAEIQKTKEQREAEMLPRVTQALELGLSVLDNAFHKVQVEETSDSEEDECRVEEGRIVLEPKDPYEHRPLPFIIGSNEFHEDDLVGLRDLYVEDFVEKLIDEESVSLASLSSSSLNESDEEIETPYPNDTATPKNYMEELVPSNGRPESSASRSSDLFDMEKQENDFTSNFEAEERMLRENEQNKRLNTDSDLVKEVKSVIGNKIEPEVPKLPEISKQEKYDDDLFGSMESDGMMEENSPFQKKSGSLFSTDLAFTNGKNDISDDDDDDLFGINEKSQVISRKKEPSFSQQPEEKSSKIISTAQSEETKAPDLFAESDDDNDIFTSLSSTKKSFSISQPSTGAIKGEQNEIAKASNSITSVPEPTKKKTSSAFTELDDHSSSDSLFGDDSTMDDLFVTKSDKKPSISHFMAEDDDDDLFSSLKTKHSDNLESKKSKDFKVTEPPQPSESKKLENSLFGDDDDDYDLFGSTKMPYTISSPRKDPAETIVTQKETSKNTFLTKEIPPVAIVPVKETPKVTAAHVKETLPEISGTVKDVYAENSIPSKESPKHKNTVSSKGTTPALTPRSTEKVPDKKLSIAENHVDLSISFDEPVDSHNTLNVINKGRAKIPGKRRMPTRKARQAYLNAENENSEVEESPKEIIQTKSSTVQSGLNLSDDSSDLFSSVDNDVASSNVQITPKKVSPFGIDKNIMSQLVSEISSSKIGKKDLVSKPQENIVDSDDDFLSSAPNDKGSLVTSDFLPVSAKQEILVETSHASSTVKTGLMEKDILESDSILEDDLFSEPAFKGFRTSVSDKDSIFGLDDDDDIFKVVDGSKQKSPISSAESSDDIFAYPEDDIFAGVRKEKYEMISNQVYEDDGDIFGNFDVSTKQATSGSNTKKSSKVEAPKKEPVDIFDDPLSAFSSD